MTMRGEISKRPFGDQEEKKHFKSVKMQMGRVQYDPDWDEAFEILLRAASRSHKDVIGKYGSPNDGFRIDNDLIIDHMESKAGWSLTGAGGWDIEYFEKFEGKGSFKTSGEVTLEKSMPKLLKAMPSLQAALVEKGLVLGNPKLFLHFKVSAEDDQTTIELSIRNNEGVETEHLDAVSCNGWQIIELDIPGGVNISEYDAISIKVETNGTVYLDRLAFDPGLLSGDDFYIQGGDGTNEGAGRYYVAGEACVKEGFETYLTQDDYPGPPPVNFDQNSIKLAYLDAWERTITGVEDPEILEEALGGPDTCTRQQLIAQVKLVDASQCEADIEQIIRENETGTLSVGLDDQGEQGLCDFKPEKDYTGLNNSLYRIEIHQGGDKDSATFKWSRNNGADLAQIIRFESNDAVIVPNDRNLCCGDLVELCDDVSDLADFSNTSKHGKLANINAIDHIADGVKITLNISTDPFKDADRIGSDGALFRHPKLRKWHGVGSVAEMMEKDAEDKPQSELEHGIMMAFSDDYYYHGDYWQFKARVKTRSVEELNEAPPTGPVHHYAPLSVINKDGEGQLSFESCRKTFPPLTDLEAKDIKVDPGFCQKMKEMGVENVQQALELLCEHNGCCDEIVMPGQSIEDAINRIGPEGGSVCLAAGVHFVTKTILIENKNNLIIRGDGSGTRVVYLPEIPFMDVERILGLIEKLNSINGEIDVAEDSETLAALENDRQEVLKELYLLKDLYELDLFRVRSAGNITFENFLMLSFGADSLVALLEGSKEISVSGCDILNLPHEDSTEGCTTLDEMLNSGVNNNDIKMLNSCIRITDCCEVTIEGNRIAGPKGLLQQGKVDSQNIPIVNGLKCLNNGFKVVQFGIKIIEGKYVVIRGNDIFPLDLGWEKEDYEKLEDLLNEDIEIDQLCPVKATKQANDFIDDVLSLIFGCISDLKAWVKGYNCKMISAFIMQASRIEENRIIGSSGINLFYSRDNEIARNSIMCTATVLSMTYNFNTRVFGNILENFKIIDSYNNSSPDESLLSVVEYFFSDRLFFDDNRVKGPNGLMSTNLVVERFLSEVDDYSPLWNSTSGENTKVLLIKRFIQLMGLKPSIDLIETIIGIFSGGRKIDLIELLFELWYEEPGSLSSDVSLRREGLKDNYFIEIMSGIVKWLFEIQVQSRAVISNNRFDVDSIGIGLKGGIPLGGSRMLNNRLVGAADTAILWKAETIFSNPDLNGLLLNCSYKLIIYVLEELIKILNNIKGALEEWEESEKKQSPLMTLFVIFTLFGISQTCPEAGGEDAGGEGGEVGGEVGGGPYVKVITNLIVALRALLKQLNNQEVKRTVMDLSGSDDRIGTNQIRGKGTGIHTNIANTVIDSNRIDIEPGEFPIDETFAIGRYISTYDKILNGTDDVDRTGLQLLGEALMGLNPNTVELYKVMVSENAAMWIDLDGLLNEIRGFIQDVPATGKIKAKIEDLIKQIEETPPDSEKVMEASDGFVNELQRHLCGYGVIVESPGAQVVNNRVEALASCDEGGSSRRAPGGILMTGTTDPVSLVIYILLLEEAFPLLNLGGQGSLFSGNSLQWGAGYGVSLSCLALMTDAKIENNEIQNHGSAGIFCDKILPTLGSSRGEGSFNLKFPLYKLRIAENEINQCFNGKAYGISMDLRELVSTFPTFLGGVMVKDAKEVNCSGNIIMSTGEGDATWPSFGAMFLDCQNVKFEGNKVFKNGKTTTGNNTTKETSTIEILRELFPRGGIAILNWSGSLTISNNGFLENDGTTLLVSSIFGIGPSHAVEVKHSNILTWALVLGNVFEIHDPIVSPCFSKVHIGSKINVNIPFTFIDELIFSQNQAHFNISESEKTGRRGISLASDKLIFNGNMVSGSFGNVMPVELNTNKGIAVGNILPEALPSDPKIEAGHNRS